MYIRQKFAKFATDLKSWDKGPFHFGITSNQWGLSKKVQMDQMARYKESFVVSLLVEGSS